MPKHLFDIDLGMSWCSGQENLAAVLEFAQYNRTDFQTKEKTHVIK